MGLSVTAGGTTQVPATRWCSLDAMGAITAEVEWGMLVVGPLMPGTGQFWTGRGRVEVGHGGACCK